MLEQAKNYELFIYAREDTPDYLVTREVKWKLVKRLANRSTDLYEFSWFNYLYSPDLMLFFDSNDVGDQFSIRKTID